MLFFAVHCTAEVAYFAYIYAKLPKENYLTVTSHGRAALMLGKFASGMVGQILLSTKALGLYGLNLVTLGSEVAATIFALFLPAVHSSIYFSNNNAQTNTNMTEIKNNNEKTEAKANSPEQSRSLDPFSTYRRAFKMMWKQFNAAYSNKKVVLWSIWYSMAFCGYFQVVIYAQLLWIAIDVNAEVTEFFHPSE